MVLRAIFFMSCLVMVLLSTMLPADAQPCVPAWDVSIGTPGMDGGVFAVSVYDDGTGPAIYAGGDFSTAGGTPLNSIARREGSTWIDVAGGVLGGAVRTMLVFDDGIGPIPALYVGGQFTDPASRFARWDGVEWSEVGGGLTSAVVWSMAVFDDGMGPALYVVGQINGAGGAGLLNSIARWDGVEWSDVGDGLSSVGLAVIAHDDGTGEALYVGGFFVSAGGQSTPFIAKWDGMDWSPVGSGMNNAVYSLISYDDGSGPVLYAGGAFTSAGGNPANRIAKWDGTSWSALGSGVNGTVLSLEAFDDGGGSDLYVGGEFTTAGGMDADHIARWDGAAWLTVEDGADNNVHSMVVFDDGTTDGEALYVGGEFTIVDGGTANRIARWTGCPGAFQFRRGDVDGNGSFSGLIDGLFVLNFQFIPGSPVPTCMDAADADDSGTFSGIVDGLYLLNFQFVPGSPMPPAPGPFACGPDPTDDPLDCASYSTCP